ncbi:MAG: protein adenylyltransferase SelO family protein, partial [Gammaproteobacteria bacterium]
MKLNPFKNTYVDLGGDFYQAIRPVPVRKPELFIFNQALCDELGLAGSSLGSASAALYSGNDVPEGAAPLAMAYSGHQFGHFNP